MKVNGPSPPALAAGRGASRPIADGFAPEATTGPEGAATASSAAAMASVGSLEALLALQETLSPTERRRRAVRRGGRILDALDDLRLAVLDPAEIDGPALERLQAAVREARGETEDPGLNGVLEEIELRAAVELAKREMKPAA